MKTPERKELDLGLCVIASGTMFCPKHKEMEGESLVINPRQLSRVYESFWDDSGRYHSYSERRALLTGAIAHFEEDDE